MLRIISMRHLIATSRVFGTRKMSMKALVQELSLPLTQQSVLDIKNRFGQAATAFVVKTSLDESQAYLRVYTDEPQAEKGVEYFEMNRLTDTSPKLKIRVQQLVDFTQDSRVELVVPQYLDLSLSSIRGDVELQGKLEGDVRVELNHGNIRTDKIR